MSQLLARLRQKKLEAQQRFAWGAADESETLVVVPSRRSGRSRPQLRKHNTELPTRSEIRAWIEASPKTSTLGDGAEAFGISVTQFLTIRDGGSA
jgi:hypothetical protein